MIGTSAQILGTGATVVSSGTAQTVALPNDNGGVNKARFIRMQATGFVYIRVGNSAVTVTTNDTMISANEAVWLNVSGCTTLAYLQETAGAKLSIAPVES